MLRQGVSEVVAGWQQSAVEPGAVFLSQLLQCLSSFCRPEESVWQHVPAPWIPRAKLRVWPLRALPYARVLELSH